MNRALGMGSYFSCWFRTTAYLIEVICQCPCKLHDVSILALRVPQYLNLSLQLQVHSPRGLAEFLLNQLTGTLVGGDTPALQTVQLLKTREWESNYLI